MPPSHTLRALFVASAALVLPVAASAQGYSTAPLTTDPYAFGSNGMPSNGNAFFQWLAQPHPEGMPRRQAVLEHTYALISRVVKERYRDGRRTDLPVGDTTTAHLFDFASRIGAIGASQVSLALGRTPGGPESGVIPPEFTLKLNGPMFTLAAEAGRWQLQFPYYFMVGNLLRQQLDDGRVTDIAGLSTLFAADSSANGASQGTFLIASTESDDLAGFTATWLRRFELGAGDTIPMVVPQVMQSFRRYSASNSMWVEMTALKIPSGSMIVVYAGLPGTYQANRPHYIDLLRSLQAR